MTSNENLDFLETIAPQAVKFYAAGVQFREDWQANLATLKEGDELELVPEPINKYEWSKDAIRLVSKSGIFLGYVPAKKGNEKNLWVKEKWLEGKQLKATVLEVNLKSSPWQALLVEIAPIENPNL